MIIIILTFGILLTGCNMQTNDIKQDFRKDTSYKNTDLIFDNADGKSNGTILLIHGTAPQNIDGQISVPKAHEHLNKTDPEHYMIKKTYRKLSKHLNKLGWNTVRYTRLGVYSQNINLIEYGQTDLKNIVDQLKAIWAMIPSNRPRVAFAWSGGSVHVLQLPLKQADAIIILGGIATKRTDIFKLRAKNEKESIEVQKYLSNVLSQEGKISRTTMLGSDMPYGRFYDENNLNDNWTYLKDHKSLPVLILHGDMDKEVDLSQAKLWNKNLPQNKIKTIIKAKGNHAYGTQGNQPDMKDLAVTMNTWLSKEILNK